MRTEKEMFDLLLSMAERDARIRLVGMEGSRTNVNVPRDSYQDYDISFVVTDMQPFIDDEAWLDVFGKRVILQKPEAMQLFPPEMPWFSFLMIFEDGVKIDLSIIPLELLDAYLVSDKLLTILLDKDGLVPDPPAPTDADFWIHKPSAAFVDDCCNEFWFVTTYIAKGLLRDELLFAAHMLEAVARPQLFNMLGWKIGVDHGYGFSLGKYNKYIRRYLSADEWALLLQTYRLDGVAQGWAALEAAFALFRQASRYVADSFGYPYPDYDEKVTAFIDLQRREHNAWTPADDDQVPQAAHDFVADNRGAPVAHKAVAKPKQYYDSIYADRESMFKHSPYALEERLSAAVTKGDDAAALAALRAITSRGEKAVLAKDPLRSAKNSMIGSIAFLARAAIQAGVSANDAFALSDALTQRVEEMTARDVVLAFEESILLQFIALVRQRLDASYSVPVVKVMHYVENHLDAKITLNDAAAYAGIHPAYLSARFKQETGLPFTTYAATRKIQESSYFVRHTAYSISQIASLYGFSSQSYYITTFKKIIGATPMEYRRRLLAE